MSDLLSLENDIITQINNAADEQSLEDIRVGAIGKKGTVSEKMKTLGKMTPEERQEMGPLLNGLKARVTKACLLYTSPSPRDQRGSRMPSSA